MERILTFMLAATLVFAGCKKSEDNPELSVEPATISASAGGGTYTFAIGSNTKWSVAVVAGATWCTVAPTAGTENGTVTVNVRENAATVTRAATVTIAAGMTHKMVNVTQDASLLYQYEATDAPPDAASNKVWVFGNQTWSDAIHISECNQEGFTISDTDPQCCSYTYENNAYYYYNWLYVITHADKLCPSPWRVPTRADFDKLENITYTNAIRLQYLWGFGGMATDRMVYYVDNDAYYWSSTERTFETAYDLFYTNSGGIIPEHTPLKFLGYQVRCVK